MSKNQGEENLSEQRRLTQVFFENEGLIKSVIFTKIANRQLAEDIFQDFFLSFITSPPKNHDNLKSYIRTRLSRDIIDFARKNARYRSHIDHYSKVTPKNPVNYDTPEFQAIVNEEQDKMFGFLTENLTKTEAKAVALRHLDGYTTSETAEIMDVHKRSASRYLAIGVKKLRKVFEPNSIEANI